MGDTCLVRIVEMFGMMHAARPWMGDAEGDAE